MACGLRFWGLSKAPSPRIFKYSHDRYVTAYGAGHLLSGGRGGGCSKPILFA